MSEISHQAQLIILLLTGEEHFVEMSAYEAAQMLQRRQQGLEKQAIPTSSQVNKLPDSPIPSADSLAANTEEGILEISEDYDELVHGPLQQSSLAPMTKASAGRSMQLMSKAGHQVDAESM